MRCTIIICVQGRRRPIVDSVRYYQPENARCRACLKQPSLVWDCSQVLPQPRMRNQYRRCRRPVPQRRRLLRRRHIRRPKSTPIPAVARIGARNILSPLPLAKSLPIPVAARTGNISLTQRPAAIKTPRGNHIRPLISLRRRTKTECVPTAAETTIGGEAYSAYSRARPGSRKRAASMSCRRKNSLGAGNCGLECARAGCGSPGCKYTVIRPCSDTLSRDTEYYGSTNPGSSNSLMYFSQRFGGYHAY